ncbi:MAG TPA: WD40 repeat domain-containing protein, partial [Herpetosiphonaceae bacterium]|nr:WD40 repeat domain-containing protein [Herpetosiphonaceae bacterium]
LAGTAFALLLTFAPAESWETWRESSLRHAEFLPMPRFLPLLALALALAGGLWLAYAQGSQNCRWIDRATGRSGCVGTLEMPSAFHTNLSFTADGSGLLATNGDKITVYDFPGRRATHAWALQDDALIYASAIAADGSHIALVLNQPDSDYTKVEIYRRGETAPSQTITVSETSFPDLGFAADGRSLLIDNASWDIATGAPLGTVDSDTRADYRTGSGGFVDVSADGSLILRESGATFGIYRIRFDGSIGDLVAPLPRRSTNDLFHVAFSADNGMLATATVFDTTQVDIWRTSDGAPLKTIALTPSADRADVEALAFTPDGRHLLVARQLGTGVEIYRLP